jgi:hypothetical protein
MYLRVKVLQWVRHAVRVLDNGTPKQVLEGSLGGRKCAGKLRNRWEDEVRKDADKWLHTKNRRKTARCKHGWRKQMEEAMGRKRVEEP